MSRSIYINGLGYYVPDKILTNEALSKMVETSDEWIQTRTGIRERHIIAPGQNSSEMGANAARNALQASGTAPDEITHIITAALRGDAALPSAAAVIQKKLGITNNCMAVDINAACSGFVYGLELARGLITATPKAKVLLITSEILSNLTDWNDRTTCVLFGDGASATVLSSESRQPNGNAMASCGRLEDVQCMADGLHGDILVALGGCSDHPYKKGDVVGDEYFIKMQGREVFKHAVRNMVAAGEDMMRRNGYCRKDIDVLVPHQANLRIIQAVGERLGFSEDSVFVNVNKYGNTSATSIPLALSEAVESGFIKPGMRVLLTTFGAGLTWGAAIIQF